MDYLTFILLLDHPADLLPFSASWDSVEAMFEIDSSHFRTNFSDVTLVSEVKIPSEDFIYVTLAIGDTFGDNGGLVDIERK